MVNLLQSKSLIKTFAGFSFFFFFGKGAGLSLVTALKSEPSWQVFFKNLKHRYQNTQFLDHLPLGCLLLCSLDRWPWKNSY